MKYIITEEQFDKLISQKVLVWLKRRFELVKTALLETYELMRSDICRINDYEKFEKKFFSVMMDSIHAYYYDDEKFGETEYKVMYNLLMELFYSDCTEFYFNGRERC